MCTQSPEACPFCICLHAGSCRLNREAHGGCAVHGYQQGASSGGLAGTSTTVGSKVPNNLARSTGRDSYEPRGAQILAYHGAVAITAVLGHAALRRSPRDLARGRRRGLKCLSAKLTRSKISGPDKRWNFRLVIVVPDAYVHQKQWLCTGWNLLLESAPFERDYLLASPTSNYKGCRQSELQYHTAFTVQNRVIARASYRGQRQFTATTGHH